MKQECTKVEYNGYNYLVIPRSHSSYYSRETTYHVLTNNQTWAGGILNNVVGYPDVESKGEHDIHYKQNPTIINAFKPYYDVKFVEDDLYEKYYDLSDLQNTFPVDTDSYYVFTYREPYDD